MKERKRRTVPSNRWRGKDRKVRRTSRYFSCGALTLHSGPVECGVFDLRGRSRAANKKMEK